VNLTKQLAATAACVVLMCLVASISQGQGTFALKYADFTGNDPLAEMGRMWTARLGGNPPVKSEPEGLSSKAVYFRTRLGGTRVLMLIDPADTPKLYVDTDVDLDLADEKAIEGSGEPNGFVSFGTVAVTDPEDRGGKTARFGVQAYISRGLVQQACLTPAGMLTGEAEIGGTTYTVAVVDGNMNGTYGDKLTGPPRGQQDVLAIDFNGNGRFDRDGGEILPIGEMTRVGAAYYGVRIEPDGSSITLEAVEPQFGALKIDGADVDLNVFSSAGYFHLGASDKTEDGVWRLPVGKYTLLSLQLSGTDEEGEVWTLMCLQPPAALRSFEIVEGKTLELSLGAPLALKIDASKSGDAVSIGIALKGQGGEPYLPGGIRNGERKGAPKLKIYDEDGTELASGAFSYG
jgi:hypothetical protein